MRLLFILFILFSLNLYSSNLEIVKCSKNNFKKINNLEKKILKNLNTSAVRIKKYCSFEIQYDNKNLESINITIKNISLLNKHLQKEYVSFIKNYKDFNQLILLWLSLSESCVEKTKQVAYEKYISLSEDTFFQIKHNKVFLDTLLNKYLKYIDKKSVLVLSDYSEQYLYFKTFN